MNASIYLLAAAALPAQFPGGTCNGSQGGLYAPSYAPQQYAYSGPPGGFLPQLFERDEIQLGIRRYRLPGGGFGPPISTYQNGNGHSNGYANGNGASYYYGNGNGNGASYYYSNGNGGATPYGGQMAPPAVLGYPADAPPGIMGYPNSYAPAPYGSPAPSGCPPSGPLRRYYVVYY
jgi:hypothetical protein